MVELSRGEKNFIRGGIAQDLRCDGRSRLSYRPIHVDTGVIPQVQHPTSSLSFFYLKLEHFWQIKALLFYINSNSSVFNG